MFQEEYSLITSLTAGVRIKEMTMSERLSLSLSALTYEMTAYNMDPFLEESLFKVPWIQFMKGLIEFISATQKSLAKWQA